MTKYANQDARRPARSEGRGRPGRQHRGRRFCAPGSKVPGPQPEPRRQCQRRRLRPTPRCCRPSSQAASRGPGSQSRGRACSRSRAARRSSLDESSSGRGQGTQRRCWPSGRPSCREHPGHGGQTYSWWVRSPPTTSSRARRDRSRRQRAHDDQEPHRRHHRRRSRICPGCTWPSRTTRSPRRWPSMPRTPSPSARSEGARLSSL